MPGYQLDPDALEKAIKDLRDLLFSINDLRQKTANLVPGELSAGDKHTRGAHQAFKDIALNEKNSFLAETNEILKIVEEKVESYRAVLEEYKRAEDNASIDSGKIKAGGLK